MSKFGAALGLGTKSALALSGAAAGATALGVGLGVSVKMATDFEASMRNVNSIAKLSEGQFKALGDDVLALAGPTAQAPKTLADGLYELVSSGFSAKQSMKILESSAVAATAGLTDTGTATEAVAAILNAYSLPASKV
jgi:TP901 family phage tail tape measure protein